MVMGLSAGMCLPPGKLQGRGYTASTRVRGLYPAFFRGKQELQERSDAAGPGGFIVFGALDALVMQIAPQLPSFAQKDIAKPLHIFHSAPALARARIQPDSRNRLNRGRGGKTQDHALVPPHGRRKCGNLSENLRQAESQIKRKQPPERGAADPRILDPARNAVSFHDEWPHFFKEKFGVAVRPAAAEPWRACRRVFTQPLFASVVNAHNDER